MHITLLLIYGIAVIYCDIFVLLLFVRTRMSSVGDRYSNGRSSVQLLVDGLEAFCLFFVLLAAGGVAIAEVGGARAITLF